jgi:TatD DNase family protein
VAKGERRHIDPPDGALSAGKEAAVIIDSHAHYASHSFDKPARFLGWGGAGYTMEEGDREQILEAMDKAGICCSVEPGVNLASNEEILRLCAQYPGRIFPAIGVHPTRAIHERWADRKKLRQLTTADGVVAIGETGLDYHYERKEQHRLRQYLWFFYQLDLARKRKKPVIYHVRDAHGDALRILKRHPARKLGGVIHCFTGTRQDAESYVAMGFYIGIGGAILQQPERSEKLWEAVKAIPLERILVETDAPFVLPYCKDVFKPKQVRRMRNTSLSLPAVIERIAQLKGVSPETVAEVTTRNAIRLFDLPVEL